MEVDEKILVARAREGDRYAFDALVRQHQRRVFRVAAGILRNEEDAMDIAQEAFVKAFKNLDRFKGDSAFYTWLHRITSNLCIDLLRKKRGEKIEYDDGIFRDSTDSDPGLISPREPDSPSKAVLKQELGEKLSAALNELSDAHRQILVLREVEAFSYEEISEILGIRKGTVMSRIFHARKNMQDMLEPYLSEEEKMELAGFSNRTSDRTDGISSKPQKKHQGNSIEKEGEGGDEDGNSLSTRNNTEKSESDRGTPKNTMEKAGHSTGEKRG